MAEALALFESLDVVPQAVAWPDVLLGFRVEELWPAVNTGTPAIRWACSRWPGDPWYVEPHRSTMHYAKEEDDP